MQGVTEQNKEAGADSLYTLNYESFTPSIDSAVTFWKLQVSKELTEQVWFLLFCFFSKQERLHKILVVLQIIHFLESTHVLYS